MIYERLIRHIVVTYKLYVSHTSYPSIGDYLSNKQIYLRSVVDALSMSVLEYSWVQKLRFRETIVMLIT